LAGRGRYCGLRYPQPLDLDPWDPSPLGTPQDEWQLVLAELLAAPLGNVAAARAPPPDAGFRAGGQGWLEGLADLAEQVPGQGRGGEGGGGGGGVTWPRMGGRCGGARWAPWVRGFRVGLWLCIL
jgi:hypothetical protein